VVEQPGELRGAEIGVEEEAGLVPNHGLEPHRPEALAVPGRSAVLPDDGVRERPPAVPLPEEGRLALVGDPDRGDRARAHAMLGEYPTRGPDLGLPEKLGIVLDPAGLRIDLWMLLLGHAEEGRTLVEEERPRAGRALVEGEEIAHKGAMVQCPRGWCS
jgi:hypothetical protein